LTGGWIERMLAAVELLGGVGRMKVLLGLRVILTLSVAALVPLALGHCALMPLQASAAAIESGHHDDGDDDCCSESAPSHEPTSPTDACCCGHIHLSAATTPATVSVDTPTSVAMPLAVVPMFAAAVHGRNAFVRLEPDARSDSPPDPSTAPQSPRSPPYSA
jgi:hypothetical protein